MDLENIIRSESVVFLSNHFTDLSELIELNLNAVENPLGLFPRKNKNTYCLAGSYLNTVSQVIPFKFFVKIARKNEVFTIRLIRDRVGGIVPEMYDDTPLENEVFLTFSEYLENSDKLWFLLNLLKTSDPVIQSYHDYARYILGVIGQKIAALHYLLSAEWVAQSQSGYDFRVITGADIAEIFLKGIEYINRSDVRKYLESIQIKESQLALLVNLKDTICESIASYPYKSLIHGDLQISNIIWNPDNPGSFYVVDWNNAHIGPSILDIYTFGIDYECDDFIDSYISVTGQLYNTSIERNEFKNYLINATVFQSLKLASQSIDLFEDDNQNPQLKDCIQVTLLKRIFTQLEKLAALK